MRHLVALLLTIVTSAISAALTAITIMAGCFLWPPIVLLCAVSGSRVGVPPVARLLRLPLHRSAPAHGTRVMYNPPSVLRRIDSLVEVFLLPPSF